VCGARVSERRRADCGHAFKSWQGSGGGLVLMALTVPHGACDRLSDSLDALIRAFDALQRNRSGRQLWADMRSAGFVRALEITHGRHGWHPHLHMVRFLEEPIRDVAYWHSRVADVWGKEVGRIWGRTPHDHHGVHLSVAGASSEYLTKMGLELTKGSTKQARWGGETPMQMIRSLVYGVPNPHARDRVELLHEFWSTMKGRRAIQWSEALRKRLELGRDSTDEELASAEIDSGSVLAELSLDQWRWVYRRGLQSVVLDIAESDGAEGIARLFQSA